MTAETIALALRLLILAATPPQLMHYTDAEGLTHCVAVDAQGQITHEVECMEAGQ